MAQQTTVETECGLVRITASDKGVIAIDFVTNQAGKAQPRTTKAEGQTEDRAAALMDEAEQQVREYFAGQRRTFTMAVDLSAGTAFQRKVWRAITKIPYGRVRSYQWVAERVGGRQYARAVGMALGANPVPIVVPCHRVVAHDGSLGGFSCGLPIKRRLLKLEGTLEQLERVGAVREASFVTCEMRETLQIPRGLR
ncbi:MAG: methylated-DNA--[protein]-cysteine S-methyltransferase [Nitrospiraceae bacterium]|nr:methylated-DNA--[protein]-cysteine S-methyltransferase [Nitrospiraceae bacterium]